MSDKPTVEKITARNYKIHHAPYGRMLHPVSLKLAHESSLGTGKQYPTEITAPAFAGTIEQTEAFIEALQCAVVLARKKSNS